jgi:hypothetical protein
MSPWQALGVAPDIGVADLRRRYAALIKEFRPETHPLDFARIREAYEVALPHARRREAIAAEAAEAAAGDPAVAPASHDEEMAPAAPAGGDPWPAPDATPCDADEAAGTTEVITQPPVAEAPPESEAEPALALHFRRFHAQAATATGTGDEAHLPALRSLLQARTQATLDDSQALEFALMRWFVESESPPLTLLFETGRAFDWHRHPARLSSWLSPWALCQMEARLFLSRDLVYARHFSGNAWLRRLHRSGPAPRRLVLRPAAVEAMAWVERWRRLGDDADAIALAACLNPVAMRQLHGLASTDLLVGLAAALFAPNLPAALCWAAIAAATVFGLRWALLATLALPPHQRLRRIAGTIAAKRMEAVVLGLAGGVVGTMLLLMSEARFGVAFACGALLVTPMALFLASCAWRFVGFLESAIAWNFQWREAVDRLQFDAFLRSNTLSEGERPFGSRLGFVQRLASIPAALRLQAVEIATRERPPRANPFDRVRWSRAGGGQSTWRRLWFALWILFAITRLVHTIGGGS